MQDKSQKKQKIEIPKNLEDYLPKYIIMYGDPYLVLGKNNQLELKFQIPLTDYFVNTFQEFYKLKKKPDAEEMYNILKDEIKIFLSHLSNLKKV